MVFYDVPPPSVFENPPRIVNQDSYWPPIIFAGHRSGEKSQLVKGFETSFTSCPTSFARLYLKIGYCNALTLLPLSLLTNAYTDCFMKEEKSFGTYFGSSDDQWPKSDLQYRIETNLLLSKDVAWVFSDVQLCCAMGSPTYRTLDAEIHGARAIQQALALLGASDGTRLWYTQRDGNT